ncbi:MAG: MBL fold metallo-hydrolase [Actinomycetota bacterium]|nr:MBL fold metallo-hydrolase [Actinomycetota bacterium]
MKPLADDVWQLRGRLPFPNAINTYLVGDVLVDAGARFDTKLIIRQLEGRAPGAHALTHVHVDHQGASRAVCTRFGVPFWVPTGDAEAAARPELIRERQPERVINKVLFRVMAGPGHQVDRTLSEGDEVAGFQVLDTPGHSAGHVSLWREADRVLILGDVLNNMDVATGIPGLREPKPYFTPDPVENRRSARRLAGLEPSLVLFGHGAPLRDTRKFVDFAASLPG